MLIDDYILICTILLILLCDVVDDDTIGGILDDLSNVLPFPFDRFITICSNIRNDPILPLLFELKLVVCADMYIW